MKKGELLWHQVGIIIIVVLSAIILIMFMSRVSIFKNIDDKICSASVLARTGSPEAAQSYVPLKCKTDKTCLSDSGDNCDTYFLGEKKVEKISLNKDNNIAAAQIDQITAEKMYECWQMMGEGEKDLTVSLAAKYGLKTDSTLCVICSRIAVDVKDNPKKENIYSSTKLSDYLRNNAIPGGQISYLEYFTNKQSSNVGQVNEETLKDGNEVDPGLTGTFIFEKETDEMAVIFTQTKPEKYPEVIKKYFNTIGLSTLGAFAASPSGTWWVARTSAKIAFGGWARIVVMSALVAGKVAQIGMNVHEGRVIASGRCREMIDPTIEGSTQNDGSVAKMGCSMVQVVPYDAEQINKMCNYIESQQ